MSFHRVRLLILLLLFNVASPFVWFALVGFVLLVVTGLPNACGLDGCGPKAPWWIGAMSYVLYYFPLILGMYLVNVRAIRAWWSPGSDIRTQSQIAA